MNPEPGWITKANAAEILECDERTIERRARAGRITARARPGFPTLYLASDVEKLRQAGSGEVRTGLLEHGRGIPSNGNGHGTGIQVGSKGPDPSLVEVLRALVGALTHAPTGPTNVPTGPTGPTLFLTLDEAAAVSGLSRTFLQRSIERGTLAAARDGRRWKIRRRDLEAL